MGGFKGDSGNENMNQVGSLQLVLALLACIFLMIGHHCKRYSLLDNLVCLAPVIKIQDVLHIQHSIDANSTAFGDTKVKTVTLHWDEEVTYNISDTFDVIVASDCTFFKEFHNALACTVKLLLKNVGRSEAIFFSPERGDSLDKFLEKIEENGLHFSITENYDSEVWKRHQGFMAGDDTWPSYEKHHCYPLMVRHSNYHPCLVCIQAGGAGIPSFPLPF
ncbi:hypothetical protein NC651_018191 [Populus alba x Populus x berolinensis]|nr:hypothetical protein NC651_018191 [Populus alba x Populus x berolinensis]